ncbi:MAG: type II secretion system protein [Alphaproteobacteria bacterium]|nr:type II secretion system protein [Alphaproteobacteria bacterium]
MTIRCGGFGSELGRSMIEMLGVLAIVGVLSVGGISAFQKAMNKHKINQVTEELSQFINELLRYSADWRRVYVQKGPADVVLSSEIDFFLPRKWSREGKFVYDSMGNKIFVRLRSGGTLNGVLDITYVFTAGDDKTKMDLCMTYYERLKVYADSIRNISIWRQGSDNSSQFLRVEGNGYCGAGKTCLKDLTLSEMREKCSYIKGDDVYDNFEIRFSL